MLKFKIFLMCCATFLCSTPLFAASTGIAKANGIEIWYETFGKREDPALLLVAGGLCQGILWPTEFCEQLAGAGFYVIRYDHRDTGFSTCFDFEQNPYDLRDMAQDAVGLLDALQIDRAHVCGLSMGGPIAELMSVYFPERVKTIILIATSCDLRPSSLAYDGVYPSDISLSRPKEIYLNWMHRFLKSPPQTQEEHLEERVAVWAVLNGSKVPFEEARYREIHREFLTRLKHPESLTNHLLAIKNSFDMIQAIPKQVKVPALVIHGSEDPILLPDHGEALNASIPNSRYLLVEGLGHVLNCRFYDLVIQEIKEHAQMTEKLLKSVRQGRSDFFRSCGVHSPLVGAGFQESRGMIYYSSGIDYAPCNGVMVEENEPPSEETIDRAIEFFSTRKLPFIWWTSANNLEKKGFQFGGTLTGIALDISQDIPSEQPRVKIKIVRSEEDLKAFSEISKVAFGLSPLAAEQFQTLYGALMKKGEALHFLAYLEGTPVGTATLSTYPSSAGIWNLGALPDYRKQGIATALVKAALLEAQKRNYTEIMAILMPKGMAWGLFMKLGFKEVCHFPFYVHGVSAEELEK